MKSINLMTLEKIKSKSIKNKMRFFGIQKVSKKQKYIKLAFFEGNKKFLYQIRLSYPKTAENLIEIMEYARKELNEIRRLLLDKKKLSEQLSFNTNLKTINFSFDQPTVIIRNLPKIL